MAISDRLRDIFRRIVGGVSFFIPREVPVSEGGRPAGVPTRVIPEQKVNPALAKYKEDFNRRADEYAQKLADNKLTVREWRLLMATELRLLHWAAAAVGAGGFGMITPEMRSDIDRRVAEQTTYLNNWAAQMERQGVSSAQAIANRAHLYAGASSTTASETMTRSQGWPKLPFEPADRTRCRTNCKCRWQWRNVDKEAGNADVYWKLGVAEHCPTCIKRAQACDPLQIRGWQFQNLPTNMDELLAT